MVNGSNKVNRHGIPLFGGTPKSCIWPRCPQPVLFGMKEQLPLCFEHAERVWHVVDADVRRMQAMLEGRRDVKKRPATKPKPAPQEVIYYVQVGGHIKIGWTADFDKRMRAYPPNSTLLAVHPGSRPDEQQIHRRFAVHRSHGQEWYPLVPVILDHIKRVVAEHGEPETIRFGAKPVEVPRPLQQKTQIGRRNGPRLIA